MCRAGLACPNVVFVALRKIRREGDASALFARGRLWQSEAMFGSVIVRAVFAALALASALVSAARAATDVDLELVLAVDVSWSMDPEEQRLQRDGYVEAFRDPQIVKAIQSGPLGRIAVTFFEWAGPDIHFMVVPWTLIDGQSAAADLAMTLSQRQISRHRMTSISSALQYAMRQLDASPFRGNRRVIDVSGDGPNNAGVSPVTNVRDEVLARGIVINGLPIMLKIGQAGNYGWGQDLVDLDAYYAHCVIGGPGSFVIPIRAREEFATATRQKLLQEISSAPPSRPRVMRAQAPAPESGATKDGYDCLIGEKNWRRDFPGWGRF